MAWWCCRYVVANNDPKFSGGNGVFTGPVPNLLPLKHLHYVSFKGHQLEGTLALSERVQVRSHPPQAACAQLNGMLLQRA